MLTPEDLAVFVRLMPVATQGRYLRADRHDAHAAETREELREAAWRVRGEVLTPIDLLPETDTL